MDMDNLAFWGKSYICAAHELSTALNLALRLHHRKFQSIVKCFILTCHALQLCHCYLPGLEVTPGKEEALDLHPGEVLHISMATLGVKVADTKGRSVISARLGDDPTKHALCVLTAGKTESFNLDLTFGSSDSLVLEVSGKNTVHLVGNFGFEGGDDSDSDEEEGEGLINMYDDDGMMMHADSDSSDSDVDDSEDEPELMADADPPVITEIVDEPKAIMAGPSSSGKKPTPKKAKAAASAAAEKAEASASAAADAASALANASSKTAADDKPTPKANGKKRAATADAGQTPGVKKVKTNGAASASNSVANGTPAKAKKDKTPVKKAEPKAKAEAKEEAAASPKAAKVEQGLKASAADAAPVADSGVDGSDKKKKRRRKSKGGGGPSNN
jgi:Nucleoplasmin-like domain